MNNISLIQPDPSDIYDINTFNNNFQTIQDAVNNIQYTCDTILQQKYSLYTVSDNSFNIDSLSIESGIYYFNIQSGTVLGTLPDNNINLNNAILLVSVGTDNSILQYVQIQIETLQRLHEHIVFQERLQDFCLFQGFRLKFSWF